MRTLAFLMGLILSGCVSSPRKECKPVVHGTNFMLCDRICGGFMDWSKSGYDPMSGNYVCVCEYRHRPGLDDCPEEDLEDL